MVTGTGLAGAFEAIRKAHDWPPPNLAALASDLAAIRALSGKLGEAMALVRDRLGVPPSNSLAEAVAAVRKGTDWPPPIVKETMGHAAEVVARFAAQQAETRGRIGGYLREIGRVERLAMEAMRPMLGRRDEGPGDAG